jgi:hypothetical protein
MSEKNLHNEHTALIIPDGRTRIYDRDTELGRSEKHDEIEIPAKDAFIGKMSSISRQYAERFYPRNWFILSTNDNKGQRWLNHPDSPIRAQFDNPPYPIPGVCNASTGKLKYWQPLRKNGTAKDRLVTEARDLGLLQNENEDTELRNTRIIFLGNKTDNKWWSQLLWDSEIRKKNFESWLESYNKDREKKKSGIFSAYDTRDYQYTLYVDAVTALFKDTGIWLEFPLLDCTTESEMISRLSDALYRGFPLHRSPYSLEKISIKNLFRMNNPDFHYPELPLGNPSMVRIITAPNGYGKSTIFRLIRAIFRGNLKEIASIPFDRAEIVLKGSDGPVTLDIEKTYSVITRKEEGFTISSRDKSGKEKSTGFISVEGFENISADDFRKKIRSGRLGKVIPPVAIRFMSSERLFHDPLHEVYPYDLLSANNEDPFSENISRASQYALSLSTRIDGVLTDFATMSHKMDMTFPIALVKKMPESAGKKSSLEYDKLRESFSSLKEKRKQLEKIDLLPFRKWYPREIDPFETLELHQTRLLSYQDFLELYLRIQKNKYNVFDWLNTRCQLFEEIINNLLVFTRMRIQRDKGFSFYNLYEGSNQYHELDLHEISSGEMHQVVLYYDFLFNCDPGTVVLIDEPEISLHVYAQSLFIDNLRRIADKNLNNLQFIVATHSPTIIGEHWDITYDLLTGAYNE